MGGGLFGDEVTWYNVGAELVDLKVSKELMVPVVADCVDILTVPLGVDIPDTSGPETLLELIES